MIVHRVESGQTLGYCLFTMLLISHRNVAAQVNQIDKPNTVYAVYKDVVPLHTGVA